MTRWNLNQINWNAFDKSKVDPDLLILAKTASLVEYNSADYVSYLNGVFHDEPAFAQKTDVWGQEEKLHGLALAKWIELADPNWNFERSLQRFRESFRVPLNVTTSIRGSQSAELIARCIVEVGTTTFYSSLRDASQEPVLNQICHMIAVDEVHHFNLFYRALPDFLKKDPMTKWQRAKIAYSRAVEAEDEELVYAYAAANEHGEIKPENFERYLHEYMGRAMPLYTRKNMLKGSNLAVRAIGATNIRWLPEVFAWLFEFTVRRKARQYNQSRARYALRGHAKSPKLQAAFNS